MARNFESDARRIKNPRMLALHVGTLLLMVAILAVTGLVLRNLTRQADQARDASEEILRVYAGLEQMNGLEWQAIAGELDERLIREFADTADRVERGLMQLTQTPHRVEVEQLLRSFEAYQRHVADEIAALQAGKRDEALRIDDTSVDPLFDAMQDSLASSAAELEADADATDHTMLRTGGGLLASVVVAFTGLVLVLLRAQRRSWELSRRSDQLGVVARQREHDALHDELTTLPNRRMFLDRVDELLVAVDETASFAVMLIDLDGFKEVNDTLGHDAGDDLLVAVASRLRARLRDVSVVARLGGDEFAVVTRPGTPLDEAVTIAQRIRDALNEPFEHSGIVLDVQGSVGVAMHPMHGTDRDTLVKHADVAMYLAKEQHSGVEVYDIAHDRHDVSDLELAGELRRAIPAGELVVLYQPIFQVSRDRIDGVEALVRWQHPTLGLLPPDRFMHVVDRARLMEPLTLTVLEQAITDGTRWRRNGYPISVAVNLGASAILSTTLAAQLYTMLERSGFDPAALTLEITEELILTPRASEVIASLEALGVKFAIDDFGTGYSSIGRLQELPITQLKIDARYVVDADVLADHSAIVRATVQLGHALGLEVVAEGVETEAVRSHLAELGCDLAQGYVVSEAVSADAIEDLLRAAASDHSFAPAIDRLRSVTPHR